MKKLIKKIAIVGLVGLFVLGSVGVAEAKVVQGTKGRTYITMDAIEKSQNLESIYPYVDLVFSIKGKNHYHIPITMSANGYATYRGN